MFASKVGMSSIFASKVGISRALQADGVQADRSIEWRAPASGPMLTVAGLGIYDRGTAQHNSTKVGGAWH